MCHLVQELVYYFAGDFFFNSSLMSVIWISLTNVKFHIGNLTKYKIQYIMSDSTTNSINVISVQNPTPANLPV